MSSRRDVFVIVPIYNEGAVLRKTVQGLLEYGYSVVVVDDGSQDDPFQSIQGFSIHQLRHKINLGQGAALQTGMTYALKQGARILVHFDGDGQHREEDIAVVMEPIEKNGFDVGLGSRFMRFEDEQEIPAGRRWFLRLAVIVNGLLTGLWLTDAHNGLRALSCDAAKKIHLHENGYAHASEIIRQIKTLRLKYQEVPVRVRYTKYSRQKGQSFWNGFNIIIDMILRGIFR